MAGLPNKEDVEHEGFEYVERHPEPSKLLQQYENLQCELELEYEVLSVAELFDEEQTEEKKKQEQKLDELNGSCWSKFATNIIEYTERGGKYKILTQLLRYGLGRTQSCDSNIKMSASFIIVKNCDIAMINYKRLGHTPCDEVSWNEINLALVEATVLLCILSDKIGVKFKKYFPVPHDSKSFIIALSDQRILPLYGTGCRSKCKEFDDALVAFLDCMSQLNAGVQKITPNQSMPHEIENDKIKDPVNDEQYTVRLQEAGSRKNWSRAMMFLLINMQWLLKWVTLFVHSLELFPSSNISAMLRDFRDGHVL